MGAPHLAFEMWVFVAAGSLQLRKFEETGDLKAVVVYMAEETYAGLF